MRTPSFKRVLSVQPAAVMLLSMCPAAFVAAAETEYPVMKQFTAASSDDFHAYYGTVYSVTFLDAIDDTAIAAADEPAWDVSAAGVGSVMAWMKENAEQTALAGVPRYDVYIAGNGGVGANASSGFIFYGFSALEEVKGCENFKTENATSFYGMFYNCKKLRSVTTINWNTSNVTDMSYMFRNCQELTELDLSSSQGRHGHHHRDFQG